MYNNIYVEPDVAIAKISWSNRADCRRARVYWMPLNDRR